MRYTKTKETLIIAGRDRNGSLLLENPKTGKRCAANPPAKRSSKPVKIELPLAKYEDLRVRIGLVRSPKAGKFPAVAIGNSEDVYKLMQPLSNEPQEIFAAIFMDAQNTVIGVAELHRGGITSAAIDPRIVFVPALLTGCVSIIFVHNHPSGSPKPSEDDVRLTKNLTKGADLFGIRVLDHVVIGGKGYKSLADAGMI